jgi:hypothetical protein
MLQLIGFVVVIYLGWVTGVIQAVFLLIAALLIGAASL